MAGCSSHSWMDRDRCGWSRARRSDCHQRSGLKAAFRTSLSISATVGRGKCKDRTTGEIKNRRVDRQTRCDNTSRSLVADPAKSSPSIGFSDLQPRSASPTTEPVTLVLLPGLDGTGILFTPLVVALGNGRRVIVVTYPTSEKAQTYAKLHEVAGAALPPSGPLVLLGESFSGPLAISLAAAIRSVSWALCCAARSFEIQGQASAGYAA